MKKAGERHKLAKERREERAKYLGECLGNIFTFLIIIILKVLFITLTLLEHLIMCTVLRAAHTFAWLMLSTHTKDEETGSER